MKLRRRTIFWIAAAASLLLIVFSIWFFIFRIPPAEIPAEVLFPPKISAAVRFTNVERAFKRHWAARGRDDTDRAMEYVLDAFGVWSDWVDEYGEDGARNRLKAYRKAAFQLLGKETWLVRGDADEQWLIVTRVDSAIKRKVGPLADLVLPEATVQTSEYHGVRLYEHRKDENQTDLIWASVGGWICILAASQPEPLFSVIDRYLAAKSGQAQSGDPTLNNESSESNSAFDVWLKPSLLSEALSKGKPEERSPEEKLGEKKKKKKKNKEDESALQDWLKRLDGIDQLEIAQHGDSLLDLDIQLHGPRIEREGSIFSQPAAIRLATLDSMTTSSEQLSPSILQMDFSYPFAVEGASLLGIDWKELLKNIEDYDWVRPNLAKTLELKLNVESAPEGRIGWALFPTLADAVPVAALWEDRLPISRIASSPADRWRMTPFSADEATSDSFRMYGPNYYKASTTPALARAKRKLVDDLWAQGDAPPLAFASIHFDDLAESMYAFPAIVLKKKNREQWLNLRSMARGMEYALGSVALRLDREESGIRIRTRMLEEKGSSRGK